MKLTLALLFMLFSMAYSAFFFRPASFPVARPLPVVRPVVRPPVRPVVVVRPPPTVVVRPPPTVVVRPGRDVSEMNTEETNTAPVPPQVNQADRRAAEEVEKVSKRDVSKMETAPLKPAEESPVDRRAVVVARPPTVVVRRPGKREMTKMEAAPISEPKPEESPVDRRAVVVARPPTVVVRRPGKREMTKMEAAPISEPKPEESPVDRRAVVVVRRPPTVVVRRPPTVVVRPGKRDVSEMETAPVTEEESPVDRRAVVVVRRPPTVVVRPGKRENSNDTSNDVEFMRLVVSLATGKIEWSHGLQQRIACDMKKRFGPLPEDFNLRLSDLHLLEAFEKSVEFLSLLSMKSSSENKFTFLDPLSKEPVLWSIFSKDIAGKLGFFIQNEACFKAIVTAVKDYKDSPVEFFLF